MSPTQPTSPTLVPLAPSPIFTTPTAMAVATASPARIVGQSATASPTLTAIPTPVGTGIRPGQVQQLRVPEAELDTPAEWRPPPLDVPLSIHPDDHYWLIRPIPSGRRNYDLEWYPYGNDVLLPQLDPYRIHHGLDFPNDTGTPILAAAAGTVIYTGTLPSPRNGVNYYGNTVIIQHDWQWQGKDVFTLYAHTLELFVREGDYVQQGQLIAGVGSSGEVSGPHLHLEVRVGANNYSSTRNPSLWLAPYEGWGTLAGQLVDRRGRFIPGADITVTPVDNPNVPIRRQKTYLPGVNPDENWQENFVVPDLPAGRYQLLVSVNGVRYQRDITLQPHRTNFEVIATEFSFIPTATPTPTPTITPGPSPTATLDPALSTPTGTPTPVP